MLTAGLGTFVTYNPASIRADASLTEAARLMEAQGIRHLPVVDDQRGPVGILSDLDLAQALLLHGRASLTPLSPQQPGSVGSLMVHSPITVELGAAPSEALQIILRHRIHSVPVVDNGKLVGMVTSTDFLRELSYGELLTGRKRVGDVMKPYEEAVIEPTATVFDALKMMQLRGIEYLVVARHETPVGIFSLRDARQVLQSPKQLENEAILVHEVLQRTPPTIFAQAKLQAAASTMLEHRQKGLAVVARTQKLTGLLTEDQILAAMLGDFS